MAKPRRASRIARGLRISAAILIGLLLLAEIGVRVFGPVGEPPPLRFEFASRLDADLDEAGLFERSNTLLWELRPGGQYRPGDGVNSLGLRGPEFAMHAPEAHRIAVLGDSCTFGFEVDYADTYGARLEALLRESHPDEVVQVLNAGVPGYSVLQGLRRFEEDVVPLGPEGVVLYFGAWNDFNAAMGERNDLDLMRGEEPGWQAQLYDLFCLSRLFEVAALRFSGTLRYRHWRETIDAWQAGDPPHGFRVPLADYELLFAELLDRVLALELKAIVVLPELNGTRRLAEPIHFPRLDGYRAVMRRAAEARGIPVVDLRDVFDDQRHGELFVDIVHPSVEGYGLLAEALAGHIRSEAWLE